LEGEFSWSCQLLTLGKTHIQALDPAYTLFR
jgi:hypothetical protein